MQDNVLFVEHPGPTSAALDWEGACDLLGGAPWGCPTRGPAAVERQAREQPHDNGLSGHLTGPGQFLHEAGEERHQLEVFWLKWCLFTTLAKKLHSLHELHRRPHLGLAPSAVRIIPSHDGLTGLPSRWGLTPELLNPEGAQPFAPDDMPAEMARSLFRPSSSSPSSYIPPAIREWPLGRQVTVTVLIRSMDRIPEELEAELRSLLRIHLVFEGSHVPAFSERDVFLLSFQVPGRETRPVELWARMVESLERGIVVSGVSQAMPVPLWDQLERAKERVFSNAMATVYRAFEPHHDLYSLGLLLVRLLLVNQTRSLDALSQPLDEVVTGLDPLVRGLDPDDSDTLLGRIEERLSAEGEVFQPSSVVFDPRAPRSGEAPVPGYLWYEALTIALRFLSDVPGFGFWSRASRPGSTKPLAEALRTIDTLRNRIQVELFGERRRSREIGMICAEMRSELTAKPR